VFDVAQEQAVTVWLPFGYVVELATELGDLPWVPDDSALLYQSNDGSLGGKHVARLDLKAGEQRDFGIYASDFEVLPCGGLLVSGYDNDSDTGTFLDVASPEGVLLFSPVTGQTKNFIRGRVRSVAVVQWAEHARGGGLMRLRDFDGRTRAALRGGRFGDMRAVDDRRGDRHGVAIGKATTRPANIMVAVSHERTLYIGQPRAQSTAPTAG
jgi:hypothetical protein